MGAWRTLQNGRSMSPSEWGTDTCSGYLSLSTNTAPMGVLLRIQAHFHAVIHGRAEREVHIHGLRLPELEPLLELARPHMWFAVPGMYGGFSYRLESSGSEPCW